ncbi:MAG: D-aminoacyl-tRNA deacylase [Chloroflexota bacterium]
MHVRVVAQRVTAASVEVDGEIVAAVQSGLALLVGVHADDDRDAVHRVADKVAFMRVFEDADGKINLAASDVGGDMLVISQFTLYADLSRGRRPSFIRAARPEKGEPLVELFAQRLESHAYRVARGRFGAHMIVRLENDGPVTIVLDSEDL